MLRQYHTPEGVFTREPTQEELDREFEMKKDSPDFQMLISVLAELTGKTSEGIADTFKKYYKG